MAEPVPAGSVDSLPPCPQCNNGGWQTVTSGDSVEDPYPGN